MSVTIVDIAKRAKVAPSTVSRALTGKGRIAAKTRNRIVQIALEMGYEGAQAAAGHKAICILYSRRLRYLIGDAFYGAVMEGVEVSFRTWGYRVFFSTFENQDDLGDLLRQGAHDGFIVVGGDATPEAVRPLAESGTPVVLVDNEFPGHPTPAVVTANVEGSRMLTQHLLSLGHQTIAYVAGPLAHISLRQRIEGFRQAMAEAGAGDSRPLSAAASDPWIVASADVNFGFDTGVSGFYEIWNERGLRPTAILCSNDMVALGVLHAARQSGLSVPDDLSVAGFDDVVTSPHPQLTTAKVPCREMGIHAARLLYEEITGAWPPGMPSGPSGPAVPTASSSAAGAGGPLGPAGRDATAESNRPWPVKVVLYPELMVRESTAPPPQADGPKSDSTRR